MITQLLAICYDDETDELLFKINEPAVGIYKRRYGMIGQAMERLGQHIQRREWPHFLCERRFTHIIPKNDIIKQLQPKAENYEQLIDSKGDLDFKQLTKSIDGLKIGRNIF
jgi:hypothetical protein